MVLLILTIDFKKNFRCIHQFLESIAYFAIDNTITVHHIDFLKSNNLLHTVFYKNQPQGMFFRKDRRIGTVVVNIRYLEHHI